MKSISVFFLLLFNAVVFSQNNCLHFDGSNDNIAIPHNPAIDFSINDSFTLETWFKTSNTSSQYLMIYSKMANTFPFRGYEMYLTYGKLTFVAISDLATNNAVKIESMSAYNDNNWHHAACVYNGSPNPANMQMYIDGVLQPYTVVSNNLTGPFNSTITAYLGGRQGANYSYGGLLDDFKIWNRGLCGSEINFRKNCNTPGNANGLVALYNFDHGVAGGNNSTVNNLTNLSLSGGLTGTLSGFALTGSTSNWLISTTSVSSTCTSFASTHPQVRPVLPISPLRRWLQRSSA